MCDASSPTPPLLSVGQVTLQTSSPLTESGDRQHRKLRPPSESWRSLNFSPPPVTSESSASSVCTASSAASDANGKTDRATLFSMPLTVVIFGATGDLARKKLFPALYELMLQEHIPRWTSIVGCGRSPQDPDAFLAKQCVNVRDDPAWPRDCFLRLVRYHCLEGGYADARSHARLAEEEVRRYEERHPTGPCGNRLFFLSVPPAVFGAVAEMVSAHGRAAAGGFTRLLIEKPFGRDSASFEELNSLTARHFDETQLYRIAATTLLEPCPGHVHDMSETCPIGSTTTSARRSCSTFLRSGGQTRSSSLSGRRSTSRRCRSPSRRTSARRGAEATSTASASSAT